MRVLALIAIVLLSATVEASAMDYTRDGKTYDAPSAVALWEFHAVQRNGAIFLWDPLAEQPINLGHAGRGQKYVLIYSCRFAGVIIKLTLMVVRPHAMDRPSPTLARAEQVLRAYFGAERRELPAETVRGKAAA